MGHIHTDSQYDYTASGVIVHENKVLLLLHHKLDLWLHPAGHIELDETPLQGLFREVEEETGLKQEDLTLVLPFTDNLELPRDKSRNTTEPLPFDIDIHPVGDSGHKHIDFAYILVSTKPNFIREKDGATDMRWFSAEELSELTPTVESAKSRSLYALERVKEIQQ